MVDQTALPGACTMLRIDNVPDMVAAIRRLSVRGAPAIGVAGAFGVALAVRAHGSSGPAFENAVAQLRQARPTAVNLARMVDRAAARASEGFDAVLAEALAVRDEELVASVAMGTLGADLVLDLVGRADVRAMTICNTGGLAAVERGTALAVIQTLHERGQLAEALALETRPLLQGARLTAWELDRMGAPHRLLVDSAGPFMLARGEADVVLTGADRIAANGDTANKIGTFSLALGARHAGVPVHRGRPRVHRRRRHPRRRQHRDRGPGHRRGGVAGRRGHRPRRNRCCQPRLRRNPGRADHRGGNRPPHSPPRPAPNPHLAGASGRIARILSGTAGSSDSSDVLQWLGRQLEFQCSGRQLEFQCPGQGHDRRQGRIGAFR